MESWLPARPQRTLAIMIHWILVFPIRIPTACAAWIGPAGQNVEPKGRVVDQDRRRQHAEKGKIHNPGLLVKENARQGNPAENRNRDPGNGRDLR